MMIPLRFWVTREAPGMTEDPAYPLHSPGTEATLGAVCSHWVRWRFSPTAKPSYHYLQGIKST